MTDDLIILGGTFDWGLLRRQKQVLSDVLWRQRRPTKAEVSFLEGLVNLIDAVQDSASQDLGADVVFKASMPRWPGR